MAGAGGAAGRRAVPHVAEPRRAGPPPVPSRPCPTEPPAPAPSGFFVKFGTAVGYIINTFLAAARQSINLTLNTVLPFMAYVSILLGFVIYTGVAKWIGELLAPLSSNPLGLVVIGFVVALPFLSPILGPGAAVAQIVGVLMGTQIATGRTAGAVRAADPVRHRRAGGLRLHPGRTRARRGQGRDGRGRHTGRAVQPDDHLAARGHHRLARQLRPVACRDRPFLVGALVRKPFRTSHPGIVDPGDAAP